MEAWNALSRADQCTERSQRADEGSPQEAAPVVTSQTDFETMRVVAIIVRLQRVSQWVHHSNGWVGTILN